MATAKENQPETLNTALLAAKGEMGKVLKNADNPFFKSKYSDLGAVLDVIDGPMQNHGLIVHFDYDLLDLEKGSMLLTKATMIHTPSGETLTSSLPMPIAKMDCQAMGSILSYSRRYILTNCFFNLWQVDDDGNAGSAKGAGNKPTTSAKPSGVISEKQRKMLFARFKNSALTDEDMKAILADFGYKSSKYILAVNFTALLERIEKEAQEADDLL